MTGLGTVAIMITHLVSGGVAIGANVLLGRLLFGAAGTTWKLFKC